MSRDDRALKRIIPFCVRVNVEFIPDTQLAGYEVNASGIAEIGDKRVMISASPQLCFTAAQWFYSLHFNVAVNANKIVSLVNKANKD